MHRACSVCGVVKDCHRKSLPAAQYICWPCRRIRKAQQPPKVRRPRSDCCNICGVPAIKPGSRCREHRYKRTCKTCSSPFFGRRNYCSDECKATTADCLHCNRSFTYPPGGMSRRWCSPDCKRTYLAEANRKPKVQWNCKVCGELVTRDSGPVGMYCTQHRYTNPRQRANQQKRDAIKRGGKTAQQILKRHIYERDNWTCGICRRPVDKRLKYPDPMSASLDHIEPLARGGTHTKANVQCAHLNCNVRKGSREPAQQLLLIG